MNPTVSRIKHVSDVARKRNVPDFGINARCDVLVNGSTEQGKRYLEAGATSVFV